MLRSVLVMEYKLSLRNGKRILFQNRDDLKVFTDNRILTEDKVVMVNGSGVNLDQFPRHQAAPDNGYSVCPATADPHMGGFR